MEQLLKNSFSITEIEKHPEIIINILKERNPISMVIVRQGDHVNIGIRKVYSKNVTNLSKRIQDNIEKLKTENYPREKSVKDFRKAQEKLRNSLKY